MAACADFGKVPEDVSITVNICGQCNETMRCPCSDQKVTPVLDNARSRKKIKLPYCDFHGEGSHTTKECRLKRQSSNLCHHGCGERYSPGHQCPRRMGPSGQDSAATNPNSKPVGERLGAKPATPSTTPQLRLATVQEESTDDPDAPEDYYELQHMLGDEPFIFAMAQTFLWHLRHSLEFQ